MADAHPDGAHQAELAGGAGVVSVQQGLAVGVSSLRSERVLIHLLVLG